MPLRMHHASPYLIFWAACVSCLTIHSAENSGIFKDSCPRGSLCTISLILVLLLSLLTIVLNNFAEFHAVPMTLHSPTVFVDRSFLVCDHPAYKEFRRFRGSAPKGISRTIRLLLYDEVHCRLNPHDPFEQSSLCSQYLP